MRNTQDRIPVAEPLIGDREREYVLEAVTSGWVSSIGEFVDRFETGFAAWVGARHGVSTSTGTDALLLTMRALGIGPGAEVIVPGLTFAAVAAVVRHLGADPVLVDVRPDYWCLDPVAVERAISSRTRAIVAVHSYGHAADMDALKALAEGSDIYLLEDCAEAHGARYKGRPVGSMGQAGCFSFYGNKIMTTGEGGMVVTDDRELAAKLRFYRDHAMDRSRGHYYHTDTGYNCRLTNLQAALGCAQLENVGLMLEKRRHVLELYRRELVDEPRVELNPCMDWCEPVNWMVCAVLSEAAPGSRDQLMARLERAGIITRPFFVPLAELPPYRECATFGARDADLPNARQLAGRGLNLPSSPKLDEQTIVEVCSRLKAAIAR